ncbi:MAG TPA: diguanylate cyclase, partial [Sedimentibacter sp.]|nr:diguanylate cyclase [Sedimentibacter sp.]HOG63475.1 diguanylate cyclase [Sedimentibacter sp.]HPB80318.1 diguanylate cyclase [Sedimentibacter sp.]HQO95963.1 diguanylate cyclase [Sedimentibacter sp.]
MEYPSKYDFYLKFKPVYNKEGYFLGYVLIYVSDFFINDINIGADLTIGKKFSEIVVDSDILGLKEFYFNIIPKSKMKLELYNEDLKRWYLINAFTDMSNRDEHLIIHYADITEIKQNQQTVSLDNNIYYLNDRERLLYKDKLTGLYNKTYFEEELSRLDTKRQLPISLIMGDINGLKLINDAFGHSMGD